MKADNEPRAPVTVNGDVVVMMRQMIKGVAAAIPEGSQRFTAPLGAARRPALPVGDVVDVPGGGI